MTTNKKAAAAIMILCGTLSYYALVWLFYDAVRRLVGLP